MSIAFLRPQPAGALEHIVDIDPIVVTAMNSWRNRQNPQLAPNDAILALLRIGLVAEGDLKAVSKLPNNDPRIEAMVAAFRQVQSR